MPKSYSDIDDFSDQELLNSDLRFLPSSSPQYKQNYYEEDLSSLPPLPDEDDVDELKELEEEQQHPSHHHVIKWHPIITTIVKLINNLILLPIFRVLFAPYAQQTVVQSLVLAFGIAWILLTSFTAYLTFYQRYIPQLAHIEPIYFQYPDASFHTPQGHVHFVDSRHQSVETLLRDEQAYDISIQLHVPTSDINFNLGNFMVYAQLQTLDGTVLIESSRPAILRYQSYSQRILRVLAKSIPLLIGWTDESQHIHIPLIESYIEKKATPITQAHVTLSTPKLQVYNAQISVIADFHGLRYYMYHRRILTAIIFIVLFTLLEAIFAIGAWNVFGKKLWYKLNKVLLPTNEFVTVPIIEEEDDDDDDDNYLTED
ncbi:putative adipose-regulatory protein-domain-containing protein [Cokeromyces recurvatus]|uniref:putative adipose-regulatory protein-domain-containing protein n=1 Tax=Cokeromyces recurvatus TaxID=90255 RepID=UPI00221E88C3|nr:putative adipose-regulatory protein-domain-containing protein [Cokeromyces recurvatus]KAI7898335.1 putative adipose-regulatory protein-domain-containing protein [Cokeromyces recurvatus]